MRKTVNVVVDVDGIRHAVDEFGVVCQLLHARGGRYPDRETIAWREMDRLVDIGSFCPLCYNKVTGIDYQWPGMDEYIRYMRASEHINDWEGHPASIVPGTTYRISWKGDRIAIATLNLGATLSVKSSWPTAAGTVAVIHKPFETFSGKTYPAVYVWGTLSPDNTSLYVADVQMPGKASWAKTLNKMTQVAHHHAEELCQMLHA